MEQRQYHIEMVPAAEVAKILGTDPTKIKTGILNGTLPIGCVLNSGGRDRVIIPRPRLEAWLEGRL